MKELTKQLEDLLKENRFSKEEKGAIKKTIQIIKDKDNQDIERWFEFVSDMKGMRNQFEKTMNKQGFEFVDFEYDSENLYTYKIDLKKGHYRCWLFEISYFKGKEKPFLFSTVLKEEEKQTKDIQKIKKEIVAYFESEDMLKFLKEVKTMV